MEYSKDCALMEIIFSRHLFEIEGMIIFDGMFGEDGTLEMIKLAS